MRHHPFEQPDDDDEDSETQVFYEGKTDQDRYAEMAHINLSQQDINHDRLRIALDLLEKSWFWRFRSAKSKLGLLMATYSTLNQMM